VRKNLFHTYDFCKHPLDEQSPNDAKTFIFTQKKKKELVLFMLFDAFEIIQIVINHF